MTLADLLAAFTRDMRDTNIPPLVSEADRIRFANAAERQVCRRTFVLRDPAYEILLMADDDRPTLLPSNTIIVHSIWREDGGILTKGAWDDSVRRGRPLPVSRPSVWFQDSTTRSIVFDAIPSQDETLYAVVSKYPSAMMAVPDDVPEVPEEYHEPMVYWMRHLAYLLPDSDMFDKSMAEIMAAKFTEEVGESRSLDDLEQLRRRPERHAQCHFF